MSPYAFPSAAYAMLVLLAILGLYWYLFEYRKQTLKLFAQRVIVPRSTVLFFGKVAAICVAWLLLTYALMQPRGYGQYEEEYLQKQIDTSEREYVLQRKAHDVVILIDASASMETKDARIGQSRFDEAKEIADEIVGQLKGETVAVYAFTDETSKLSPLTMDYLFARLAIKNMQINEGEVTGTNLEKALSKVDENYFLAPSDRLKTLIVITDGGETPVHNPIRGNVRIFTIGVGSEKGGVVPHVEDQGAPVVSKLNSSVLKPLSLRGRYYKANDFSPLIIAQDIRRLMDQDDPYIEEKKVVSPLTLSDQEDDLVYDLYFQVPLGFALVLLAFVFFFPDTRFKIGHTDSIF